MDPRYDEADDVDEESARNPWLVALWAVSIGLVVLSVVSFGWINTALSNPEATDGPDFIPFLFVPPALFVGGAFGVVIALALQALHVERERR